MRCFRDMTFCSYDKCKEWETCGRALTDKIIEEADTWWINCDGKKGEAPICKWMDKPGCFKEKE